MARKCPRCNGTGNIGNVDTSIGDLLLTKRKEAGLTQQELSEISGVGRSQIANIEVGRSEVSTATLFKLAKAFECSPRELIPE